MTVAVAVVMVLGTGLMTLLDTRLDRVRGVARRDECLRKLPSRDVADTAMAVVGLFQRPRSRDGRDGQEQGTV